MSDDGCSARNTDDHHNPAHSLSTLGRTNSGTYKRRKEKGAFEPLNPKPIFILKKGEVEPLELFGSVTFH